jgi:hypothetical protein
MIHFAYTVLYEAYKAEFQTINTDIRENCKSPSIYLNDTNKTLFLKWINAMRIVMLLKKMYVKKPLFPDKWKQAKSHVCKLKAIYDTQHMDRLG